MGKCESSVRRTRCQAQEEIQCGSEGGIVCGCQGQMAKGQGGGQVRAVENYQMIGKADECQPTSRWNEEPEQKRRTIRPT